MPQDTRQLLFNPVQGETNAACSRGRGTHALQDHWCHTNHQTSGTMPPLTYSPPHNPSLSPPVTGQFSAAARACGRRRRVDVCACCTPRGQLSSSTFSCPEATTDAQRRFIGTGSRLCQPLHLRLPRAHDVQYLTVFR